MSTTIWVVVFSCGEIRNILILILSVPRAMQYIIEIKYMICNNCVMSFPCSVDSMSSLTLLQTISYFGDKNTYIHYNLFVLHYCWDLKQ